MVSDGRIYDILVKQNGRLYICGKVSMASSINETLKKVISENAKVSLEKAMAMVQKMKDEGRYSEDIFGN